MVNFKRTQGFEKRTKGPKEKNKENYKQKEKVLKKL